MKEKIKKFFSVGYLIILFIYILILDTKQCRPGTSCAAWPIIILVLIPGIITFIIFVINKISHKQKNIWSYLFYFFISSIFISLLLIIRAILLAPRFIIDPLI